MKDINLIPDEIKSLNEKRKKNTITLIGFLIVAFVLIFILLLPNIYINNLEKQKFTLNNQLNSLKAKKDMYSTIKSKENYYLQKEKIIKDLSDKRLNMTEILNDISSNIPENVSIKDMKFNGSVLEITGDSYMNKYLSDFMLNLRKLKYVDDVNLLDTKKSDSGLIQYTLQIKLKVV
ncbi:PilN domain-containing protein [Thermoanaerobacterium sp. R66]|uniref:PilN domain-containing protein n=1 Tax=Thermoanaerobacterium sp. R66 TaxID=2742479 RepID=UPI00237FF3AC|nr:PilN domain-containing protein [Thermoanaerobacterium sp. R66]MDE4541679.1 PilN domain-containing protein [Thermoanaerobacterium sp. R66]